MIRYVLTALLLYPLSANASNDLCTDVLSDDGLRAVIENPETCGLSMNEKGAREAYCAWRYPQSSYKAQATFARLTSALETCADPSPSDQLVNHPDSYDLRVFHVGDQSISIALKEKFALEARYIFIRVSR